MFRCAHVRLVVLLAALPASACTTANIGGGDVATSPVGVPGAGEGAVLPGPGAVIGGTPVTASEPSALRGGVWVLTALGDTEVTPDVRNPAHLSFAETNRVSGSTGCNQVTGSVTVNPETMRFEALVSTRRACPTGVNVEARFLAALEATRSWGLSSGELHLRDAAGDTVATLEHRDTLPGP